jgi:predicted nucleic acid-binding protein
VSTSEPNRYVLDASAAVALLADAGPAGQWVESTVKDGALVAPDLMPFEAANILRRQAALGLLDVSAATLAHADLVSLAIDFFPYAVLAERAWQLRADFTIYDASYVALAELAEAALITLDRRLARAPGTACRVLAYE